MNILNTIRAHVESRSLAIVSTAHMTEEDNRVLSHLGKVKPYCFIGSHEYGWHFRTPDEGEGYIPEQWRWSQLGLSWMLWENLQALNRAEYDRVEFDRDGPVVPGLHRSEW